MIRYISVWALGILCVLPLAAENWVTHFAYNNVTQIAMSQDMVYALSDGSLFGVNKQSEKITIYNRLSGLHSTGISCIHYDENGQQLLIAYSNGKIDILTKQGMRYIGDLYNKDMTQRKDIYNVTIQGRMAYLSTHFGVQTFDLRENKLVDSYWLRPGGLETPVMDVSIKGDSIYAFSTDSLYCASMKTNLSDYTVWKRELRSGRIAPDPDKGVHYKDANSEWYAGGNEGIIRFNESSRITYMPQGPLYNTPYSLATCGKDVWVVPGGRWAAQYNKPGVVMHYNGSTWINIDAAQIKAKTGINALDFMNTAVDPSNPKHYFVTSYGTGLYEFYDDTLYAHYLPDESNTLIAIIPADPKNYTRLSCAMYDSDNNLWLLTSQRTSQLQCFDAQRQWHAVTIQNNGEQCPIFVPCGMFVDKRNDNYKWIGTSRDTPGVILLDDGGTRWDESDDKVVVRSSWTDQNKNIFKPNYIYGIAQDAFDRIWIITDFGAAYIDQDTDFFQSDAIVRPDFIDNNGENPITTMTFKAITVDAEGKIWLGNEEIGVYVLNSDASDIVAHYTTENSAFPSNTIMSLEADQNNKVWIGTSDGLVCHSFNGSDEGVTGVDDEKGHKDNYGTMQQWRLHISYNDATEIIGTSKRIFAIANNSLLAYNRNDGALEYWDRSKGLNGNTITHLGFDKASQNLLIAYIDGRIDLMDSNDDIRHIPDLFIKAGEMSMQINNISSGSKKTYLSMTFGIIALDCKKGEVSETYYIGDESQDVNVVSVVEKGDSLYAFSANMMYSAGMSDNLADYQFWHKSNLPIRDLTQATMHLNQLYTVQHDSLYRYTGNSWELVCPQNVSWIHESDGQLLVCSDNYKLYQLNDGKLEGLCDRYYIHDAVYSQGEYWLGEYNWGLIHLNKSGDDYYHPAGPNNNYGYSLCTAHGHIYEAIGGRWATEYATPARINIYDGETWRGSNEYALQSVLGKRIIDPVSIAVDKKDPGHFYVATYGCGVIEYRNYEPAKQHTSGNSTLQPVSAKVSAEFYTRTDGATMDENGNLWVMNATFMGPALHVLTPDGIWHGVELRHNGNNVNLETPAGIWIDRRDGRYKWMMDQRGSNPGLYLHYDNGTPTKQSDDRSIRRSSFVDQDGKTVTPGWFRCIMQDHANRIWIGTDKGIIVIPSEVDFFTSNQCRRIIIPRNDGSNLGDYLLGEEQINCMAVDGGDRIWIGTENSGLYLIEEDTITVAHFTENNSLLPSNKILSIAIEPTTGEVFVGTDKGIASYRSDASEPQKTMASAYAYPNPVRPGYEGVITIAGLMDNTTINIIDAGGNLVCKTRSHGGTAVWDGRLSDGRKATPGVYTAMCNAQGGHTVVKILVIR